MFHTGFIAKIPGTKASKKRKDKRGVLQIIRFLPCCIWMFSLSVEGSEIGEYELSQILPKVWETVDMELEYLKGKATVCKKNEEFLVKWEFNNTEPDIINETDHTTSIPIEWFLVKEDGTGKETQEKIPEDHIFINNKEFKLHGKLTFNHHKIRDVSGEDNSGYRKYDSGGDIQIGISRKKCTYNSYPDPKGDEKEYKKYKVIRQRQDFNLKLEYSYDTEEETQIITDSENEFRETDGSIIFNHIFHEFKERIEPQTSAEYRASSRKLIDSSRLYTRQNELYLTTRHQEIWKQSRNDENPVTVYLVSPTNHKLILDDSEGEITSADDQTTDQIEIFDVADGIRGEKTESKKKIRIQDIEVDIFSSKPERIFHELLNSAFTVNLLEDGLRDIFQDKWFDIMKKPEEIEKGEGSRKLSNIIADFFRTNSQKTLKEIKGENPFDKVTQLGLPDKGMGDSEAILFAGFPSLKRLDLRNNNITLVGTRALAGSKTLTYLDLSGNNINDRNWFGQSKWLEYVSLPLKWGLKFAAYHYAVAASEYFLYESHLGFEREINMYPDEDLKLPNLRKRRFPFLQCFYSPEADLYETITNFRCEFYGQDYYPWFNGRTVYTFWRIKANPDDPTSSDFPQYKYSNLDEARRAASVRGLIPQCFIENPYPEVCPSYIRWFRAFRMEMGPFLLVGRHIWNQFFQDPGAQALANSKTLTSLNIAGTSTGNVGTKALARNKTIKKLDLSNNRISNIGARHFLGNNQFVSLKMEGNNITASMLGKLLREPEDNRVIPNIHQADEQVEGETLLHRTIHNINAFIDWPVFLEIVPAIVAYQVTSHVLYQFLQETHNNGFEPPLSDIVKWLNPLIADLPFIWGGWDNQPVTDHPVSSSFGMALFYTFFASLLEWLFT